jgi:hypothetical protein
VGDVTLEKLALAQRQLETAIGLFLSRTDRISAISLAGAADGILHGLVLKAGKQPFADYALGVREALHTQTPAKAKFAKHINDQLKINDLKHMDEAGADQITFDPDLSALGSILKAVANHHTLVPNDPPWVKAILHWAWLHYDGSKITEDEPFLRPAGERIVERYHARPESVKKMEPRLAKKHSSGEETE